MKAYSPFFCLLLLIFLTTSCNCNQYNTKNNSFLSIDTIVIPFEVLYSRSVYVSEYNTQINTFFSYDMNQLVFHYCIDSISSTTSFKLNGPLSNYFSINKNLLLINYPSTNYFYLIDGLSNIIDSVSINIGKLNNENRTIWSFYYHFTIKQKNGEYFIFTDTSIPSFYKYQIDKKIRKKRFSEPIISQLTFSNNQLLLKKYIGKYPNQYLSDKGAFNYQLGFSFNKNNEMLVSFYEIDSVLVVGEKDGSKMYYIHSKYKTKPFTFSDKLDYYNQMDLNIIATENTRYTYNYYDSYRDQYYIIVNHPIKYENDDGTLNDISKCPWSIIVLNKDFIQVDEIDMPAHLNKHQIFIVPNGLAIFDYDLSEKKIGKSVFVVYKIQNYE